MASLGGSPHAGQAQSRASTHPLERQRKLRPIGEARIARFAPWSKARLRVVQSGDSGCGGRGRSRGGRTVRRGTWLGAVPEPDPQEDEADGKSDECRGNDAGPSRKADGRDPPPTRCIDALRRAFAVPPAVI